MAHSGKEAVAMRCTKCVFLLLLLGLSVLLAGCEFRDILDDYPVSGVQIKLDWKGVTEQLSEGMRVIFYPKAKKEERWRTISRLKGEW